MTEKRQLVLVLILGLSFVATVGALVFGRQFAAREITPHDSFSKHALGSEAAVRVLERAGVHVLRRESSTQDPAGPMLFFEPSEVIPGGDPAGFTRLGEFVAARARAHRVSIVVLPKWRPTLLGGSVEPAPNAEVDALLDATLGAGAAVLPPRGQATLAWVSESVGGELGGFQLALPSPQAITPPPGARVLVGTGARAFVVASADGRRVVVTDPDLFHNFNLARADHAPLLLALLSRWTGTDTVVVDEAFHGHAKGHSIADLLARFPNVLFTVWGVLTCLTVVLLGLGRFGPPRRTAPVSLLNPVLAAENAAKVIALRPDAPAWIGGRYVEAVLRDVARRFGIERSSSFERASALDASLSFGAAHGADDARSLLARAEALRSGAGALGPRARRESALALAQSAHRFRALALGRARLQGAAPPAAARPTPPNPTEDAA